MSTINDLDLPGTSHREVYAFLRDVREEKPLFFSQRHNGWIISRYDDLVEAVNNPDLTVENALQGAQGGMYCEQASAILAGGVDWNRTRHVQSDDGPDHARFRKALLSVINPARVRELQSVIQHIVDDLVAGFESRGRCEFVSEFAYPLAMLSTLNLIGFTEAEDDMSRFPVWIDDTFRLLLTNLSDDEQVRAATHAVEFQDYIKEKIAQRRANPREDLLSDVLGRLSSGEFQLSDDELVVMFTHSFVGAGHETTKLALTNSIYHLLDERERWESLVANPQRTSEFVEECLRYDAPLFAWFRYCAQDTTVAGETIRKGDKVILLYGSANHDAQKFAQAGSFCPFRGGQAKHLSFNTGKHFCVGAPLARLELNTALATLSRRIPGLRLSADHDVTFGPNFGNRVIRELYLEW